MNTIKYILLATFLILYGCKATLAQPRDTQSAQYDTAKTYITSERYGDAIKILNELIRKNEPVDIAPNASYYLAYSYYKTGSLKDANFVLFQLINKYPFWSGIDLAYYLKGIIQFESKNYFDAFSQWQKVKSYKYQQEAAKAKYNFLGRLSNDTLQILSNRFPEDQEIKNFIYEKLDTGYTRDKGSSLNIAVLLPFESAGKNHFVYELYTGLQVAIDSLRNEGIRINLIPFETDKDSVKVQNFVNNPDAENFDMVIGPLYSSQQKYIDEFSYKTKIPVINPLSNYVSYSVTNPYYFLFQPSYETQGIEAARYAYHNFTRKNTSAIVYGSNPGDTLMAYAYKQEFEKLGGKVLVFKRLNKSIAGYFGAVMNKVVIDSIGHVFVSSTEPSLAANVFSSLEGAILEKAKAYKETLLEKLEKEKNKKEEDLKKISVADVPVLVPHEWLDFQSITYDQIIMHNTHFIFPEFVDQDSIPNTAFVKNYLIKAGIPPTDYSYQGFDMMLFFGRALYNKGHKLAKYFTKNGFNKGYALRYFDFSESNSNKYVPIVKIEDLKLKQVNTIRYVEQSDQ